MAREWNKLAVNPLPAEKNYRWAWFFLYWSTNSDQCLMKLSNLSLLLQRCWAFSSSSQHLYDRTIVFCCHFGGFSGMEEINYGLAFRISRKSEKQMESHHVVPIWEDPWSCEPTAGSSCPWDFCEHKRARKMPILSSELFLGNCKSYKNGRVLFCSDWKLLSLAKCLFSFL